MAQPNPYELLGLPRDADLDTVKSAYRTLARRFHPDQVDAGEKENAAEHFRRITDAYRTILDGRDLPSDTPSPRGPRTSGATEPEPAPVGIACVRCGRQIPSHGMIAYTYRGEPCHPECMEPIGSADTPPSTPRVSRRVSGKRTDEQKRMRQFQWVAIGLFFSLVSLLAGWRHFSGFLFRESEKLTSKMLGGGVKNNNYTHRGNCEEEPLNRKKGGRNPPRNDEEDQKAIEISDQAPEPKAASQSVNRGRMPLENQPGSPENNTDPGFNSPGSSLGGTKADFDSNGGNFPPEKSTQIEDLSDTQ